MRYRIIIVLTACTWTVVWTTSGLAQFGPSGEAFLVDDVGVGQVSFLLSDAETSHLWHTRGLRISCAGDRLAYTVYRRPVLPKLRSLLMGKSQVAPLIGRVYFLFHGEEPLAITIHGATDQTLVLEPKTARRGHQALWQSWWDEQTADATERLSAADHPPTLEWFLIRAHARRFGLDLPESSREQTQRKLPKTALDLLTEPSLMGSRLSSDAEPSATAASALPAPLTFDSIDVSTPAGSETELAAGRVPDDCYYVRFGSFSNLLWFTKLLEERTADIGRLVQLRSIQPAVNQKIERQLAIEELPFAELLGDKVIADVALIGRDFYFERGPAIGVLIHARTMLIGPGLTALRNEVLKETKGQGATLEKIQFGKHAATLLSTPDNVIRSYHLADGNWHLLTNCRRIAEDYAALGSGGRSIANDPEFQAARTQMPQTDDETLFVFLPRKFLAELASPQHRVELMRRDQSAATIESCELARWAADYESRTGPWPWRQTEGHDDVDQFVASGLLPESTDASQVVLLNGRFADVSRGRPGSFVPVPDVPVTAVTEEEASYCEREFASLAPNVTSFAPVSIRIRRPLELQLEGAQTLRTELRSSPFDAQQYRWLRFLQGEATAEQLEVEAPTIANAELMLRAIPLPHADGDHHLLLGVLDTTPHDPVSGELGGALQLLREAPSFVAAWPNPGFLNRFVFNRLGRSHGDGLIRGPIGLWKYHEDDISAISGHQSVLQEVAKSLRVGQAAKPAQARAFVGDLSESRLASWLSALAWNRNEQATVRNVRLLNRVGEITGNHAELVRQRSTLVSGGTLQCPLGGDYVVLQSSTNQAGSRARWTTTAWSEDGMPVARPTDYKSALLRWFRGLEASVLNADETLQVDADLVIRRD